MSHPIGPAYRIETRRLVIRCYDLHDATLLHEAVMASLEHLKAWMPWAHAESQTLQDRIDLLRRFRGEFDLGQDFAYGIFTPDEKQLIGSCGLCTRKGAHTRQGAKTREIGYWTRVEQIRQGYATESAAALTRVAFEVDQVRRVEIRCDPENAASAAIPARLGFSHEGTLRSQSDFLGRPRDTQVWSLLAEEYPASSPASATIRAFDAAGRLIFD